MQRRKSLSLRMRRPRSARTWRIWARRSWLLVAPQDQPAVAGQDGAAFAAGQLDEAPVLDAGGVEDVVARVPSMQSAANFMGAFLGYNSATMSKRRRDSGAGPSIGLLGLGVAILLLAAAPAAAQD